jgi:MtN3 and saliva related transmembrane protein
MLSAVTIIGAVAAFCTAVSNLPQVIKAWRTHSVGDLSLKMILLLSTGLALWIVYGVMEGDPIIIAANVASLLLAVNLLVFKLKEVWGGAGKAALLPQAGKGGPKAAG